MRHSDYSRRLVAICGSKAPRRDGGSQWCKARRRALLRTVQGPSPSADPDVARDGIPGLSAGLCVAWTECERAYHRGHPRKSLPQQGPGFPSGQVPRRCREARQDPGFPTARRSEREAPGSHWAYASASSQGLDKSPPVIARQHRSTAISQGIAGSQGFVRSQGGPAGTATATATATATDARGRIQGSTAHNQGSAGNQGGSTGSQGGTAGTAGVSSAAGALRCISQIGQKGHPRERDLHVLFRGSGGLSPMRAVLGGDREGAT